MKFKEIFEQVTPDDEQAIKDLFKSSKFDLILIPAIGSSGADLVFKTKNKKDAKSFDVKGVEKLMKKFDLKLDKKSDQYPGGTAVQGFTMGKNSDNDPHEIYISFIN